MAVAVRLSRFGKKGHPFYRIVVVDKRSKRDGAYIENIGTYNPSTRRFAPRSGQDPSASSRQGPRKVIIKKERFEYWILNGAQVSEGLAKLLKSKKNVTFDVER